MLLTKVSNLRIIHIVGANLIVAYMLSRDSSHNTKQNMSITTRDTSHKLKLLNSNPIIHQNKSIIYLNMKMYCPHKND